MHVPRGLQELAWRVDRAAHELEREVARPPTPAQLAERTGLTTREVHDARDARRARYGVSLDGSHAEGDATPLAETIGVADDGFRRVEDLATVERLLSALSDREREVVRLRICGDLTQVEIGERLGLSQAEVSRLLRRALGRLVESAEPGASG